MTARDVCMRVHRWSGLAIALFLLLAGLSGAVIAYEHELETALLPGWFEVEPRGEAMSPFELARIAERLDPLATVTRVELNREPAASAWMTMAPRPDPATDAPPPSGKLNFDEVFLDPYTGEVLGKRLWGEVGLGAAHLVPMVYRLHTSLLLGDWGVWLMGIVALVWCLNCFVGFYLTLPVRSRRFFNGWKPSWLVRATRPAWRLAFEFHRAAGLWLWGMLLVFALSALQFNLNDEIFRPALTAMLPYENVQARLPVPTIPAAQPALSWEEALSRGRELMARHAARQRFGIAGESYLYLSRERETYVYSVNSSLDVRSKGGDTSVYFSVRDGRELAFSHPSIASGNAVSAWLSALHLAKVGGWPYQAFVSLLGLIVATLSFTGVVVWFKRRASARGASF